MCNNHSNKLEVKEYINIQTGKKLDWNKINELPDNAMLKVKPELWEIWYFEKNDKLDFDIWKMTKGMDKRAWWYCPECEDTCPLPISKKTLGRCCSICSGYYTTRKNSFGGKYPELAKEWHPTKNGELTPYDVSRASNTRIWWLGKCGHEWETVVKSRTSLSTGCPYCTTSNAKILKGFNDMWTTNPKQAKLLVNPEDGYKYGKASNKKVEWKCSVCNESVGLKSICSVARRNPKCNSCSDGISFCEKLMFNLLTQLNVTFISEFSPKWSNKRRYDFYIPSLNMIIETHGMQHYKGGFERLGGKDKEAEVLNDILKMDLALNNGIVHYIELDCRYLDIDYIKNSILNSILINFLDLKSIDWVKIDPSHDEPLINKVSALWNIGYNVNEIMNKLNMKKYSVDSYLKRGYKIGLNDYKPVFRKPVVKLNFDLSLIESYTSTEQAIRENKISRDYIIKVINGEWETYKGFKWMYKEDYDKYIEQQNSHV